MASASPRSVVEIALPDVEEMRALAADGLERGALTYDEIVGALQDADVTKEQLEDFYSHLVEIGVEVLDADGYDAFVEAGSPFAPEVATRLKHHIYAAGNSVEPGATYAAFRGRPATVQPLLKKRGLLEAAP